MEMFIKKHCLTTILYKLTIVICNTRKHTYKSPATNIVLAIGGRNGFVSALVLKIPPIANKRRVTGNVNDDVAQISNRLKNYQTK